ncbi:hypothetical protein [Tissierella praeacuta]|uniref:hypothetical protein n=1 Tax=Tissierella praeacuta TaxID=43131 RepID=UPI00333E640D
MKSRIMYILLVFLLSTSITACSGSKSDLNLNNSSSVNNSKDTDTSPSLDSKSEDTKTTNNSVLEAYKAVLLNNAEFFSVDNKKKLSLNDFLTNKEIYGTILKVTHFTVLDMDGDDVPEVILELAVDNNPEFYEVLHYMDDTVYGYNIVYRGLEGLKTDGTFQYSNGAADNGYGKLKFQSNAYETDILGYMESSQNNDDITISYFINNKSATKESYNSSIKEQDEKEDVVWYEFSQKNMEAELSVHLTWPDGEMKPGEIYSGHSKEEIEDFAKRVVELIQNDESHDLAEIIQYPLNANLDEQKIYIKDKETFLENYNLIFNDKFKLKIKDVYTKNIWSNSVGFIIGNGDIWFANDSSDGKLKIIVINSGKGEMLKDEEEYGITQG